MRLELDQVWAAGSLLAELEPTACDLEVGVALPNLAVVLRAERSAYLQRAHRIGVVRLQLDILSWLLHAPRF